jgi:hypothetical protein
VQVNHASPWTDTYDSVVTTHRANSSSSARLSALPSRVARILAFVSICLGGAFGGLIGFALVEIQCTGDCATPEGLGVLIGATLAAGGTAIVAVLVLRALGEWRELSDQMDTPR